MIQTIDFNEDLGLFRNDAIGATKYRSKHKLSSAHPTLISPRPFVAVLLLIFLQIPQAHAGCKDAPLLHFLSKSKRRESPTMCRAHSHNDYHQANPLSSALHHGLNSIEVDVFPKHDGSLLVAHTVLDLDPRRTIETMYIQPILGIFKKQRQPEDSTPSAAQPTGRSPVESRKSPSHRALTPQGGDPEGRLQQTRMPSNHRLPRRVDRLNLLVDFKGDADKSASLLQTALTPLRPYLSKVDKNGVFKPGRLTVVISGNRPRADSLKAPNGERFLFLDGRVKDVRANAQTDLVPLISVPWRQVRFARAVGRGDQFMRRLTERAHSQGKLVRIWGAPNKETAWGKMLRSNIDLLSIDDHPKFAQFVAEENKAKS